MKKTVLGDELFFKYKSVFEPRQVFYWTQLRATKFIKQKSADSSVIHRPKNALRNIGLVTCLQQNLFFEQ